MDDIDSATTFKNVSSSSKIKDSLDNDNNGDNNVNVDHDIHQSESNTDSEVEVFDRIASKLLRSGLLLTALELHAELIERGKQSTRLRDFFDNPHNFEKHFECSPTTNKSSTSLELSIPKNIVERSPSEKTFDSLDFTHYSDDDIERQGDERIAVLEFELRKAQQTINSLRASLTMSTTGVQSEASVDLETNDLLMKNLNNDNNQFSSEHYLIRDFYSRGSADGDSCPGEDDKLTNKPITISEQCNKFEPVQSSSISEKYSIASLIKPHEKRAINYLINEYLMANNYKLTSITFCDENTDQDFDNWEDVGLNIPRPPDLLKLYRQFWKSSTNLMRTNSIATTIVSNSNRTIVNDEFGIEMPQI